MGQAGDFPKAVVFDLDGTLIDSAADITSALARALQEEDLSTFDVDTVKTLVGGGSRRLIERAVAALRVEADDARLDRLTRAFERHYLADPSRQTRLYPGATGLLEALMARGIDLGICTNKPAEITQRILAALDLDGVFAAVVAGSDDVPKKPDPAMLHAVLARLGVTPAEAVMIGDSAADVGSARAVGCPVVLVSFGYAGGNVFSLQPDMVVDNHAEMLPALGRLFFGSERE